MTVWPNGSTTIPKVSSEFGPRKAPIAGASTFHNGIDLVGFAINKSPVTGVVIFAAYNGGAGNHIRIREDGTGDTFDIMHNKSFLVSNGQRVTEKEDVGVQGMTGTATGVHCHFETHPGGGKAINPRDYMAGNHSGGGSKLMSIVVPGVSLLDVQNRLLAHKINIGPTGADNANGPATSAGLETFQRAEGLVPDRVVGNATWAKLSAAPAPSFPPFPLPAGSFFGPEGGPATSVSGYHGHAAELMVWQQRMEDRGWNIIVDGHYGPKGAKTPTGNTASVAGAFQREKGLKEDKLIGKATWDAAWTTPVT